MSKSFSNPSTTPDPLFRFDSLYQFHFINNQLKEKHFKRETEKGRQRGESKLKNDTFCAFLFDFCPFFRASLPSSVPRETKLMKTSSESFV
jgi:hypothetical protein